MLNRQRHFKISHLISDQWSPSLQYLHSFKHATHLFDEIPQPNVHSTNRSMLDSLHKNLPFQALRIFKKQLQLGFAENSDEVTVALALKASCADPQLGCLLHGLAISSGFTSYVTVSNSLMNMYCKSGQFERGFRIFETLSSPDIVSWNTILSGFRNTEDALNFSVRMNSSGVVFDPVTYTTVLAFCSCPETFSFGLQLHSLIVKFGFDSEIFVGNALITMYARHEHLEEARRVFDEMPSRDLVSWSAILSGYTQEGNHGLETISTFIELVRQGMKMDHVSFTCAVSACGQERNINLGRQVHGLAQKTGFGTHVSVCNVLMSTYSKCEAIEDSKLVFGIMNERNVISWTTMISTKEEEAMSLFNSMRLDGVYPNDVTFIALIHAVAQRNLVEEGQMIHGICIKSSFLSELNVSNTLITMYAKFESMQDSIKIFEELPYREIISWNALISGFAQNSQCHEALETFFSAVIESKPNQYTFGSVLSSIASGESISIKHGQRCHSHLVKIGLNNDPIVSGALLDMYAKRGSIHEAQRVFNESPQRSQFSWTAIISSHTRHGDYESVMKLFSAMEKEGVKPDSITFLSVLTACSRKGMVDMGRQIFYSMIEEHSIDPSPEHYSCMVDMLGRAGRLQEAEEMLGRIPGRPGLSVLQSLLGACKIHGNVEMGERVADALMKMEPMESGSYVLMSNLYAQKGEWEMVAKLRKGMREKGVRKEVGFSWVDAGNVEGSSSLHGFSSGDMSHLQSEEIYRMAQCLGSEMRFLGERDRRERVLHNIVEFAY